MIPLLESTELPDEYFGTQSVRIPIGKEVITLSIRLSVFGEVEIENKTIFELPEAALQLMYGKAGAATLCQIKDIFPFIPPLIAVFQPPDYLLAEWMRPIKKKLLALAKGKTLQRIGPHYIKDAWVQEMFQVMEPLKFSLKPSETRDIFRIIGKYGMDEFGSSAMSRLNLKCFVPILLAKVKYIDPSNLETTFEARGDSWMKNQVVMKEREVESQLIKAINLFGLLADKRAIPFLHEVMQRYQDKYAVFAAEALSKCGDETAIPLLLSMLNNSSSEDAQVSAMLALANLQGEDIIPTFIQKLDSLNENIQITAAYVLGNLQAQEAFTVLLALAEDIYEASRVRISAIKALVKLDADATKVMLQNLVKSEKDEEIVALCVGIFTT